MEGEEKRSKKGLEEYNQLLSNGEKKRAGSRLCVLRQGDVYPSFL